MEDFYGKKFRKNRKKHFEIFPDFFFIAECRLPSLRATEGSQKASIVQNKLTFLDVGFGVEISSTIFVSNNEGVISSRSRDGLLKLMGSLAFEERSAQLRSARVVVATASELRQ